MRFKKSPQLTGAGRTRAWHHHGSHTPTSPGAILLSKMTCQPKHFGRQCMPSPNEPYILAKRQLATILYDSTPRPRRCFANPNPNPECTLRTHKCFAIFSFQIRIGTLDLAIYNPKFPIRFLNSKYPTFPIYNLSPYS